MHWGILIEKNVCINEKHVLFPHYLENALQLSLRVREIVLQRVLNLTNLCNFESMTCAKSHKFVINLRLQNRLCTIKLNVLDGIPNPW